MGALGDYRIIRELGRGSMAIVYLVEGPDGHQYAIKTFTISEDATQEEWDLLRELLIREGKHSALLDHPNIIKVLEVDKGDPPFIVMEYVEGQNLENYLKTNPPLDHEHAISLLRQAASALDCAAAHGLVHRDVKPANMIVSPNGIDLKLVDFGIAKGLSDWASTSSLGGGKSLSERFRVGTLRFMSPEQITEPKKVTGRADQYALATIAYLMLTGQHVFPDHENEHSLSYAIVKEKPPAPSSVNHALGRKADRVIRRALSKKPEARYDNCAAFVDDLAKAVLEPGGVHGGIFPAWLRTAAIVLVCAAGLGGGIYYLLGTGASLCPDGSAEVNGACPSPPPPHPVLCPDGSPKTASACPGGDTAGKPTCPDRSPMVNGLCPPPLSLCSDGSAPVRGTCVTLSKYCPDGSLRKSGACPPRACRDGSEPVNGACPAPPPEVRARFAIQILANGKPLPDHASFPESDETYGLLARGDLAASVTAKGNVPPGAHMRLEWEVNGVVYSSSPLEATGLNDHAVTDVYRNMPGPGSYRVILKVDEKPKTEFNFQITADKS